MMVSMNNFYLNSHKFELVLCAKELVIPESDFYDSTDEEDIKSSLQSFNDEGLSYFGHWLFKRDERDIAMEVSQLHLILWEKLVVDNGSNTFLRMGTTKGDAVRRLVSEVKWGLIEKTAKSQEPNNTDELKLIRAVRGVLNIHTDIQSKELLIVYEEEVERKP